MPGAWGRGTVPECPECDMWSGISPTPAHPQDGGLGCLVLLYLGSVHPQEYSRMLVLAGHQNSMSSTGSFLDRENGPREVKGFLQGLSGSSAHVAHKLAHTCECFARTSTHSSRMWSLWPWRLVGGIRLAVMREKTPGLTEPERHNTGTIYREMCPACLGWGLQAGMPWTGLSP